MPVIERTILFRSCLLVRLVGCVLSIFYIHFFYPLSFSNFLEEFAPACSDVLAGRNSMGVLYLFILEMWDW